MYTERDTRNSPKEKPGKRHHVQRDTITPSLKETPCTLKETPGTETPGKETPGTNTRISSYLATPGTDSCWQTWRNSTVQRLHHRQTQSRGAEGWVDASEDNKWLIVQCAPFSKSLNPRNIDQSVSDIRACIRFPFESSFWASLSGCKLTILPDIQPATRIMIISATHIIKEYAKLYSFTLRSKITDKQ